MIAAIYALVLTTLALAVPYVADADCAWVLWPKNLDGDFVQNLLVYDTRQECERSQKDFIKGWDQKDAEKWPAAVRHAHPSHWHCLPDTIDPRGPKGGER